jgi:hypothetical protein
VPGVEERLGFRVLQAGDAFWRPSNQMRVQNTDLAKQLEISSLGARLWRLAPGQASTRHRHFDQSELYVVLEGTGRMRVGDELPRPGHHGKAQPAGSQRHPASESVLRVVGRAGRRFRRTTADHRPYALGSGLGLAPVALTLWD